jgi:hypothetical protein
MKIRRIWIKLLRNEASWILALGKVRNGLKAFDCEVRGPLIHAVIVRLTGHVKA